LTRRLLLSYLGLAALILLILEVPLATLAARFEHQLATDQAQRDVGGLVALATDDMDGSHRPQLRALVTNYAARTVGEVTVVAPNGAVLASSSRDADDDGRGDWGSVTRRALNGQIGGDYTEDEGRDYAVAAAPVLEDGHLVAAVVLGTRATVTEHRIHQIWLALLVFAAGAIVVVVLVGIVLARSLALPLARLEKTVNRFGRGELDRRASETEGPEEVRSLAQRFNHMAVQLDELIQVQKRFVADASHQLRSPLTALRLRLENLEATADASSADALAAIGREAQRLSRIVDGLLTLGRADLDESANQVPVVLMEVVAERCEAWSALAAEKDVELVGTNDGRDDARRPLRPGDLDQILDNLLSNAVEVSPSGTRITVGLLGGDGRIAEIHVTDQGPGLREEDRLRAFDRLWQGKSQRSGHSGLGLAIVRQLAVRNGLDVELRAAPGGGLDAVVLLPAR
jgi:signal transduction histidine kinase